MQYYNNILAIEARWMIDNGVMSSENYCQLSRRNDIKVVQRGCRGKNALVAYDSMPERFRSKIEAIIGDPYKMARTNMVEDCIVYSSAATDYFESYRLEDGRHLPSGKRREYYNNAIVLDAISRLIAQRASKRRAMGHPAPRFWDVISEAVQNLDATRYPHALPANPRRLESKFKAYKSEGFKSLIHKTYLLQHKNAAKVANESQVSVMATLISDPRNLDNEQVARLYNAFAENMQWKKISASTVAIWRDKLDNDIYARRHGAVAFRNSRSMQVKRSAPNYPLYFWTLDGWDVELMYQKNEGGRITYHNRPTVIIVLDTCCKYPVGYAIGTHETPDLIKEALRNAAKHTQELFGTMYRTAQIQSDNYAIKSMMPTYEGIACKATPAQVKNAKAKIIEPWFKQFNKKYCQLMANWSGFGVTSRKELQPNSDFLNKFRKNFPDFEGVCEQIIGFIEAERASLQEKYTSLFAQMPEQNKTVLTNKQYLMLFGSTTGKHNLMQGNGINITINGTKHCYDCFDPEFRNHASIRWEIRFDPTDTHYALAVNQDETLQFILEEKYVQPMALIERSNGDYDQLRRVLDFNREQEHRIAERISGHIQTTAELMHGNKELDTLNKLLLCDSNGQHKNQRNKERLSIAAIPDENIFDSNDLYDEY